MFQMFKNICVEVCCTVDNKFFRVDLRLRQQKICCTYYHIEKWGFRIIELKKSMFMWSMKDIISFFKNAGGTMRVPL